jgi:hypothetical protein
MSTVVPSPYGTITPASSGLTSATLGVSVGIYRLPTDPLFYASLTLQNIVVGSRYRVTRRDNGQELATGVAASSTEVIAGVPCYANPMLVDITVRNASGSPTYKIFDTAAYIGKSGGSAYILQQLDE